MIKLVKLVSMLLMSVIVATTACASDAHFRVTLLGTGSPIPRPDRFGPSTLVEAGSQTLLFDAGRGVPIRMMQLNIPLGRIDALFLTHYHSDHTSGLPDIWLTGWLGIGQRTGPLHVIGPEGAKALMAGLQQAYAADVKIREADEKLSPETIAVQVEEFNKDGVVYERDGVRVTAFEVNHGDAIKPAYGYRIDYQGHSAVISGDTRFNQNVIKYGTAADVLIHEVAMTNPDMLNIPVIQRIIAHHTSPREAGTVFARAHPKLAVFSHIVLIGSDKAAAPGLTELVAETRRTYQGPLVVGEDLMSFDIGDGGVAVYRGGPDSPTSTTGSPRASTPRI
jgi:ribonuclease Z